MGIRKSEGKALELIHLAIPLKLEEGLMLVCLVDRYLKVCILQAQSCHLFVCLNEIWQYVKTFEFEIFHLCKGIMNHNSGS